VTGSHYSVIAVSLSIFRKLLAANHKGMLTRIVKRRIIDAAVACYHHYRRYKQRQQAVQHKLEESRNNPLYGSKYTLLLLALSIYRTSLQTNQS